jgi:hypothetical protein
LLSQGWVRIQNVPPPYLYLDFRLPLTATQADAMRTLFVDRVKQIVVEFAGEARSFMDGGEAMRYVLGRQ